MPEIERETLLYDRDKEVVDLREKDMLRARLKQQRAQQAAQQKTNAARRSEREAAAPPKFSAIQELKRKREAKSNKANTPSSQNKRVRPDYSSSDDSEEGALDEDEYDTPATRRAAEKRQKDAEQEANDVEGNKPMVYADALKIRMARKAIVKFLYYPQFSHAAVDCFVRISIGQNSSGTSTYRVCRINEVQPSTRAYKLPNGDMCKRALACSHGQSLRTFEATYFSDQEFSEKEYDEWVKAMNNDQLRLPNKRRINAKLQELKDMGSHQLTNEEIDSMIEEKRRLSKIPANVAVEKMRITSMIAEARERGDDNSVEELRNELAKIDELTANRGRNGDLDRLSKLNERNRLSTMKSVSKAETSNADKRRAAELAGKAGGDPFSRLKTRPKTFYESTPTSSVPASPTLAASNGVKILKSPSTAAKKKLGGVDGLIGNIDLDLDL